ncbi:MAG: S8 family serine peptidase [Phycisphaerales bacterium]|nr:S8 family serine peptidase [Phycisphaerales bacterium]MDE0889479.1 S8 family serine peptidase [Phycisphaerales bacterium]
MLRTPRTVAFVSLAMICVATTATPPPLRQEHVQAVTAPAPLAVYDTQFRESNSDMPSWLVQLELEPDPNRAAFLEADIDEVLADTIGGGRTTQRYVYAIVGFAAYMTPLEAALLLDDPRVRRVEPDFIAHGGNWLPSRGDNTNDDPNLPAPWGLRRISDPDGLAPDYDPCGADGSGVTVVVIDSGITPDHTEFEGRIVEALNFNPNVDSPIDQFGHGTHVASTIAGATIGVAPAAEIVSLRVLDQNNSGPDSAFVAALNWLANPSNIDGPATANMSIQGADVGISQSIYFDALQAVTNQGIPIIACAGNYSYPASWSMPATSADVMCIGATNILDQPAVFTNFGPVVDLLAPGVNILAADWKHPDGGLMLDSGTSMASPMVTGVMALHLQRYPPSAETRVQGNKFAETERKKLGIIAASVTGRLRDQENANVLSVGSNGALAGSANRLLQACPTTEYSGCDAPLLWRGTTASILLGNGVDRLPPGFQCSQVISHPSGNVVLHVHAPSLLRAMNKDGTGWEYAADIRITDIASGDVVVWSAIQSWIWLDGLDRSANSMKVATGPEGFRVDWISFRDDVSGGYGYAMTAMALGVAPGDFNNDDVVDGRDLGILLANWGPCPKTNCIGDLNGDGVVDSADLGLLLAAWGTAQENTIPGFVKDCNGTPVPASWLGDKRLDEGNRGFKLIPLTSDSFTLANFDCEELNWDAPTVGFSISPSDPRLGAAILPDGTCTTTTFAEAQNSDSTYFGHGTTCDQLLPTIQASEFYAKGAIAYGAFTGEWDSINLILTKPPAIIRQPIAEDIRSISSLGIFGLFQLLAPSNSNLGAQQYQHGLASFTSDLHITLTFRDGSDPVEVVRQPRVGVIGDVSKGLYRYVVEDLHADDGREIESISIRANFEGPGIPSQSWFLINNNSLAEDDLSLGAETSPNGGQTWYPMLGPDNLRRQLILSITP